MAANPLTNPRHLLRFLKVQAGSTVAEVAKQEHVSVEQVKRSVNLVEAHQTLNTKFQFDLAIRDLVISSIPQAKQTLDGLLRATELVEHKDQKTGKVKVISVMDKTTRLEAMRLVNSLVASLQPKGPLAEVNVQQTTQVAALSAGGGETTEERFRRLRAKAAEANRLPAEVRGVPEYIDQGRDDDDDEDDEDEDE